MTSNQDDSLTAVCEDLIALRDEIAQQDFRPAADEICARLTLIATRVESLAAIVAYKEDLDGQKTLDG